jgi:hypothetical protein
MFCWKASDCLQARAVVSTGLRKVLLEQPMAVVGTMDGVDGAEESFIGTTQGFVGKLDQGS